MRALLLTLILTGCGPFPDSDPELSRYVTEFLQEGAKRGVVVISLDTRLKFGSLSPGISGMCRIGYFPFPRSITIDRGDWKHYSPIERKELIFHELGHCVLLRGHTDKFSIMYPNVLSDELTAPHWDDLLDELFDRTKFVTIFNDEE